MNILARLALAATVLVGTLAPRAEAQMVNAQTGTTYTVLANDCDPAGKRLVTFNNAATVAVTLPQAGVNGTFSNGCQLNFLNIGSGAVVVTPTTSTINGTTALVLQPFTSSVISNDSSAAAVGNYWATMGGASAGGTLTNFRNLVQNGDMAVQQRGTAERTGGTTTIPTAAYSADRWGCNANVTSGQAFCAALATTPPTGMRGSQSVYRKSAALTQPVCMMQEIETKDAIGLQGQVVTLSWVAKALGGMIADNGGVMNAFIFTGTGTDEGLQSFTASPAITPAWTGITSTITKAVTLTTSYQKFSLTATLPAAGTELGVAFCFTPTATGAGTTDGFNFSGVQLEAGAVATAYEFKPIQVETALAQRYYWNVADAANTFQYPSSCNTTNTITVVLCNVVAPTTMRKVPTAVVTTAASFGITLTAGTVGTCTGTGLVALASSSTVNSLGLSCTTAGTMTAGWATHLIGAASGATNLIEATADF